MDLRRFTEETLRHGGRRRNHVFTANEYNDDAMACEESEEGRHRIWRLNWGLEAER